MIRVIAGAAIATAIVIVARSVRTLSFSGAAAAVMLGTICVAAGWSWGVLLVAFFLSSSLLSRIGEARKLANTSGTAEKGGERDASQVLANGGVFAAFAMASIAFPSPDWILPAIGALAASTADTWATEIGTLLARQPRHILTWKTVPTGTSGGISLHGTAAALLGAAWIAAIARLAGFPESAALAAITGGFAGALLDSLLGAGAQSRRWCAQCGTGTERRVHGCGAETTANGGFSWLDNDMVNAMSSVGGAIVGFLWLP